MSKDYDLSAILDFLIGHTDVLYSTDYDAESASNLDTLEFVLFYTLSELYSNAKYHKDNHASAAWIAEKSIRIAEDAKSFIEEILEGKK